MEKQSKAVNKYENGSIYMLYCQYGDIIDRYYGSTTQELHKRLYEHKHMLDCSSKILFQKYSEDDIIIELVEPYPCQSRVELRAREGHYIRNNICVNKNIAGRSHNEWKKDNIEYIKAKKAKYRAEQPEKVKASQSKYYKNNSEDIKAKVSKYKAENPEMVKAQAKKYQTKHKAELKEYYQNYHTEHKEDIKDYQTKYQAEHKAELKEKSKAYRLKRIAENPNYNKENYLKKKAKKLLKNSV
jgi:hypothetical protein